MITHDQVNNRPKLRPKPDQCYQYPGHLLTAQHSKSPKRQFENRHTYQISNLTDIPPILQNYSTTGPTNNIGMHVVIFMKMNRCNAHNLIPFSVSHWDSHLVTLRTLNRNFECHVLFLIIIFFLCSVASWRSWL